MRTIRRKRPLRRTLSAATAALLAAGALAGFGPQSIADAAPAADGARGRPGVEASCPAPEPGEAACFALRRTDIRPVKGLRKGAAGAPDGYGPADLRSAYNLPADGGAGQTVAIVDAYDAPTAEADLAVYRQQYGLPECTTADGCLTKVDQRGGTAYPVPDQDWAGEIALDLDMVSAVAPNARILLVEADSAGFEDLGAAVDTAVALGAKYVSNSYGTLYDDTPGSGEDPSQAGLYGAHYNHPGVAVVASSGDSGFGVSFPASSPYVTSVGGTALVQDPDTGRGWAEKAWSAGGSGCSVYQAKPAFQTDSGCAGRTVADVAAVADPATGVAVYDSFGNGGWNVFGGTSASAPIIAGVYAGAGTPVKSTYPNAYPYAGHGFGLNDVTAGTNGVCSPAYLCSAATGYDAPTGLGTPNGPAAFRAGAYGEVSGHVTDSATGLPLAEATVDALGTVVRTSADGGYSLTLPAGTYDLAVDAYGYATGTAGGLSVTDNSSLTKDFALKPVPSRKLSGTVRDGSAHGWPLYARITVDGMPGGPVRTDPATGAYSVKLPEGHDYTVSVSSDYPGYRPVTRKVTMARSATTADFALAADLWSETTPGYAVRTTGATERFDSGTTPDGWSVRNAEGTTGGWAFDNPSAMTNDTGGDGGFAIVDSFFYDQGGHQDSSLISPAFDLAEATATTAPVLSFRTEFVPAGVESAGVDISTDGGSTWQNILKFTSEIYGPATIDYPLDAYAGTRGARFRFHYTADWSWWWEIDDFAVTTRTLETLPGGLVVGQATDANTRAPLPGTTVTPTGQAGAPATSAATPDDPGLGDGFYWLFSQPGEQTFTGAKNLYADSATSLKVAADGVTEASYAMKAGRLAFTKESVTGTAEQGKKVTEKLTVKNTGTAPATVELESQAVGTAGAGSTGSTGSAGSTGSTGTPLIEIRADNISPLSSAGAARRKGSQPRGTQPKGARRALAPEPAAPNVPGTAWEFGPYLETGISDNAADAYDGKIYSAFGFYGWDDTSELLRLDPKEGTWTQLAPAADPREQVAHGFIDGKLYATGGWMENSVPDSKTEIYDPKTDRWTTGAPMPTPYAASSSVVLDGKLYVIGGCLQTTCGSTDVQVYDAASDSWSTAASYPEPVSWQACGAIRQKIYCSGGLDSARGEVRSTYVLDPAAGSWTKLADIPKGRWGAFSVAANGMLLISSGVSSNIINNQGAMYDPRTNTWSALAGAKRADFRAGSALGFYKVGGAYGPATSPTATVELLPGYGTADLPAAPWLTADPGKLTLAPGAKATVTLTFDASAKEITGPGDYQALLAAYTSTPYATPAVPVTFTVKPGPAPARITGTVSGEDTKGHTIPLAGATVTITSADASYTVTTDPDGVYTLTPDTSGSRLSLAVTRPGYKAAKGNATVKEGRVTVKDFVLKKQ
ncbi:carboxypeptidase regulatory-like domain-containing protein [Streptomyces sp. NPDC051569]|uniref:carboxypeptidase regulatory-like domain-containing protein n=1 Tax=Streptomyces sp. NPDC051569 TaxID=3365661 RepID=UPI0037BB9CE8